MATGQQIYPRQIAHYGWRPDLPDDRDVSVDVLRLGAPVTLPNRVSLLSVCPPNYDQGALGSCTANAIAAALEMAQIRQGVKDHFTPSRLFIYWWERLAGGTVAFDSGATLRDGAKVVNKAGAPPESLWPYDIARFRVPPSARATREALKHQTISYARLPHTLPEMRSVLASGFPFAFGFSVYESFESEEVAKTGVMPMPERDRSGRIAEHALGGHAVLAIGYDDAAQRFLVRNSWGTTWGDGGNFTMPYEYAANPRLASDFWCIRQVEV